MNALGDNGHTCIIILMVIVQTIKDLTPTERLEGGERGGSLDLGGGEGAGCRVLYLRFSLLFYCVCPSDGFLRNR